MNFKAILISILIPTFGFCQTAKEFAVNGIAKSKNKDYEGAIADYNKSIELDSTNSIVFYNRGLAFSKLNNFQSAISDYTKSI